MDSVTQARLKAPATGTNDEAAKPAGFEDINDSSEWDVGASTQHAVKHKPKSSGTDAVAIGIDDSDDSTSDDTSSDSDHATAASAAHQMRQPAGASSSALPNTSTRRQACINSWRNLPYKQTVFLGTLSLLSFANSNLILHSLPTIDATSRAENIMKVCTYIIACIGQLGGVALAVGAYARYQNKM